jgi:hypothetical protein
MITIVDCQIEVIKLVRFNNSMSILSAALAASLTQRSAWVEGLHVHAHPSGFKTTPYQDQRNIFVHWRPWISLPICNHTLENPTLYPP